MNCPSCAHPNRPEARFCAGCGATLEAVVQCPECGAESASGERFCDHCGHQLETGAGGDGAVIRDADGRLRAATPEHLAAKIRAGAGELRGERKQVTVLFVDVVGSMELASEAGPEAWRRIMDRLFSLSCDAVHRLEGTIDKFTGDGAMALFGAPIAHEDHARRACYAALHLQDDLAAYAGELRRSEGLNLSARIGVNSGEVIVGSIGEDLGLEYTAIGHTVGLAQRMEQLAEPGKVYVAGPTADLVTGYLTLRDLGEFEVKGVEDAVRVHARTGIGSARGRLDISRARGLSRFVGRGEELEALERAFELAETSRGQVIGLVGEAGVGKSRLCHEFAERQRANGVPIYHVAAQPHARSIPLMPVLQLMRSYFDITDQDSERTARERIAGKLLLLDESFAEDLHLLFELLSVPDPDRPSPGMDPEVRQRRLFDLIKRLTHAESERQPGITIFEDLHWVDSASDAFLANQIEAVQGTRSLTVVNFRPQYHAPWMSSPYYRQIPLEPLGTEATDELLAHLLGGDASLGDLPDRIRERTAGNPFFIEEVVQSLVESGDLVGERGAYRLTRESAGGAVPASVHAVLAARIDRLAEREKSILQTAAVIGKEFSEPVLSAVSDLEAEEVDEAMRSLLAGEFVYEQELYPQRVYAFRHPLTQEVAYGSQLAEPRAATHAAVAQAVTDLQAGRLDENAALLARHWEEAGDALRAARWNAVAATWTGTGDAAASLRHWRRVLEFTDSLPESEETTALGVAARVFSLKYGWRLGMSHDEVETLFEEGERMAAKAGDIRSRAVLLSVYGISRGGNDGNAKDYYDLTRRSIALAEETEDPDLYMTVSTGTYSYSLRAEYGAGIEILDRAMELAGGDTSVGVGVAVGCPYAHCLIFKGGFSISLGELTEAKPLIERGMELAREKEDLEEVGWGHMWLCMLAQFLGRPEEVLAHARQSLEIAERIGTSFSRSWSWYFMNMAQRVCGDPEAAMDALERSHAISREQGTAVEGGPQRLAQMAELLAERGDIEAARSTAAEAKDVAIAQGNILGELVAALALARIRVASGAPEEMDAAYAGLDRVMSVSREKRLKLYEALAKAEYGALAGLEGDDARRWDALTEAERLFREMGDRVYCEQIRMGLEATAAS